jgi:hypothetical protein
MSDNRNAGILPASKEVRTDRTADILSATKAGGTPAVQAGNAKILCASNAIQTPAARNSPSAPPSRRANTNLGANP